MSKPSAPPEYDEIEKGAYGYGYPPASAPYLGQQPVYPQQQSAPYPGPQSSYPQQQSVPPGYQQQHQSNTGQTWLPDAYGTQSYQQPMPYPSSQPPVYAQPLAETTHLQG